MAKEKQEVLKEAELTNNCPECFNQGLRLTFYQKHIYGRWFHRTTGIVSTEIMCKKCGSSIYPVKWTPDIERVFDYFQKMVRPERSSLKFTPLFYITLLLLVALVGTGAYLYTQGII